MEKCTLCPKNCNVDRRTRRGFCRSDKLTICRIGKHFWEEPPVSGETGSGTVFFGGCNLRCRFCQNYEISREGGGIEVDERQLANVFLYLQDEGACNVNLVTPQHFSDKIARALEIAKPSLDIPVVYNTNSYEKASSLRRLEGLADVYLPDLKFCDADLAQKMCGVADYFEVATAAVCEMRRQQPEDVFANGLLKKGVIVRHLVLPGHVEDSKKVLDWLKNFDQYVYVSLMAQYFPTHVDAEFPELNRRVSRREYAAVSDYFFNVGLKNGFSQEAESATEDFVPQFDLAEVKKILEKIC